MTTEYTAPAPPPVLPPEPPPTNSFSRIAGVLFAPAKTFAEIARRPDFAIPLILIILIGYISVVVMLPRTDYTSILEQQTKQARKQNPNLSEADLARSTKFIVGIAKVGAWVSPILMVIGYLIMAGLLLVAFRLMGGEGNYKQAFSTTLYAWLPQVILTLVATIVVALRGTFDPEQAATLVRSNPAFLVDLKEHPLLFTLLASFDVFTIWTVVLLTLGFAALSKLSRQTSAVIVLVLWAVWIVIKVGFAALGTLMGG
ncbi:MAG TPA: Yip1 family protein [Thermoanaerobaculia bacterium]